MAGTWRIVSDAREMGRTPGDLGELTGLFADGNGRIARMMMNAELVAGGEERIVIPTVFRGNYLAALRPLSRTGRPEPLVRVLDYAQRWTIAIDWSSLEETRRELEACNAFLDSDEAEGEGKRLRMPV